MKKIIFILFTLFSVQLSAQIEQPRIKFNQVIKDSTGVGHVVISSLDDSSMIYSADFYINPIDSTLVLFGTALGEGQLSSVNVDSIYLFGDGAANPIYLDKQRLLDSLSPFLSPNIAPGLGIDTSIVNNTVVIQSLRVEEYVKNVTTDSLYKGYPVYQVDSTIGGNAIGVALADASDPTKMPAVGILKQDLAPGEEGVMIFSGLIQGVNTLGFTSGDVVYVAVGGGYTNVPPKSEGNLIQNLGRVIKVHETNGSGIIMGAGRANAVPNLNPGNIFYGDADSTATTINLPTLLSDSLSAYTPLTVLADSLSAYSTSAAFQQQFTAGGTSYTVTTADLPVDINNILVFQNGQVLDKTMFTKSGNTITLNFQPEVGDRIIVMWFKGDIVDIGGNYVTLDQPETITGAKTFTNTFTQSGGDANFDSGTLFVDATNNKVGIGTSTPSGKLEVLGSGNVASFGGIGNGFLRYTNAVSDESYVLFGIDSIGTVFGAGRGGAGFSLGENGNGTPFDFLIHNYNYKDILFINDRNVVRMAIKTGGNVGIGTSSPSAKFQVDANLSGTNNDWFLFNDTDGGGYFAASDGTGTIGLTYPVFLLQGKGDFGSNTSYGGAMVAYKDSLATENANDIVWYFDARRRSGDGGTITAATNGLTYFFGNNGTSQLAIKANGNVGIGTSSPIYKLTVEDDKQGASTLRLNNTTSGGGLFLTKGSTGIMFNGSADTWTGGGTTNDAALAAYQSNIKFFTNNSGTLKARLDANGNFWALGDISGASITNRSDIRLKENIYNYENGLNDLLQLNPVYYNLKSHPNEQRLGFIAQDVRNVVPQAITGNEENGFLGITYSAITSITVKAIQEQQTQIETLQTELDAKSLIIETQEQKITDLETENQNLNTLIQSLITRIEALENK